MMSRRDALKTAGAVAMGSALASTGASAQESAVKNARLKQSVCRWCYLRIPLEDFFKADGGRYGRVNWAAVICYLIGVAVQLPFMIIGTAYTGPMAKLLGDTDISFIVGLVVVSPLYYFTMTALARRQKNTAGVVSAHAE